jgi:hypothetical protein
LLVTVWTTRSAWALVGNLIGKASLIARRAGAEWKPANIGVLQLGGVEFVIARPE